MVQTVGPNSWTVPGSPSKTLDRPVKVVGLNGPDRPDQ